MSEQSPNEDLEDLYENAPCGYLSLQPNGEIVKVNGTFCTWTGYRSDELVGKRLRDLLNVAGSIFYETHFAPLLRMQGYFHEVALDLVRADGKKLPVLANAVERRDEKGNLVFTRVTIFQAKERRRYERELVNAQAAERAARIQLEELNATLELRIAEAVKERIQERETSELREQFIAVLGHDLRNPVAAIDAGISKLLREGWTERSPTVLQLMKQSAARMSGLIDNVLDLARSRLGGGISLNLDHERPLPSTLHQVVDEIRAIHPDRQIAVRIDEIVAMPVDHIRIAQLVSNLLSNAVTHGDPQRAITLEASVVGGMLEISVANGGDPIPPETAERLFQPFYRGEVQASREGLGLGLYIASQIAEAHGGRLEVQSDAAETRFTFRMPVA